MKMEQETEVSSEPGILPFNTAVLGPEVVIDVIDLIDFEGDHFDHGAEVKLKGSVSMSRALANGSHGLTLNEKRLMMTALRSLDSRKTPWAHNHDGMKGQVTVRVTAEQFAAVANLQERNGQQNSGAYRGLIDACEKLATRKVRYKEGDSYFVMPWVTLAEYRPGEAWAKITFHEALNKHIFTLRDKFVSYEIEMARGLQSVYTWRLLELLMREKDRGRLFIKLEDFRVALDIPDTYRFADVKRRVIDAAVEELNKKKDLIVEWQAKKTGRAVSSLDFTFVQNPQGKLDV